MLENIVAREKESTGKREKWTERKRKKEWMRDNEIWESERVREISYNMTAAKIYYENHIWNWNVVYDIRE